MTDYRMILFTSFVGRRSQVFYETDVVVRLHWSIPTVSHYYSSVLSMAV